MSLNQAGFDQEGRSRIWRDCAMSVAVLGSLIAIACYSGHSTGRQETETEPTKTDADATGEVRDCVRAKRLEIVDDGGRTVFTVQGIGHGREAFAVLELRGYGAWEGRIVRIDPQRVLISGDGGFTEVCATTAEWTVTRPFGDDDVKVRIEADADGGSVHVKSSDSVIQSDSFRRALP
jgi:hypothetical protein